ncbi:hypothetical protein J6590_026794 [Homalodisca vitripennis]|nr:hypothetical protein J6590_026794 [Homalodisca vitripennis]
METVSKTFSPEKKTTCLYNQVGDNTCKTLPPRSTAGRPPTCGESITTAPSRKVLGAFYRKDTPNHQGQALKKV